MSRHPYLLDPPQQIEIEIRTPEGGVLLIEGTLDAVRQAGGSLAQKIVVTHATVKPQE